MMTIEEAREEFLAAVWGQVQWWQHETRRDEPGRLEGLAFSMLALIDGNVGMMPAMDLIPSPHPADRAASPWPSGDIGEGVLHEQFYLVGRKFSHVPPEGSPKAPGVPQDASPPEVGPSAA